MCSAAVLNLWVTTSDVMNIRYWHYNIYVITVAKWLLWSSNIDNFMTGGALNSMMNFTEKSQPQEGWGLVVLVYCLQSDLIDWIVLLTRFGILLNNLDLFKKKKKGLKSNNWDLFWRLSHPLGRQVRSKTRIFSISSVLIPWLDIVDWRHRSKNVPGMRWK